MGNDVEYLGIVKNGVGLLTSFRVPRDEKGAVAAHREAARSLCAWALIYPHDDVRIRPLSRRDARGWEVSK